MLDTTENHSHSDGHGPPPRKRNRVMIVDDDPEIRHLLSLLFESEGLLVVGEAQDGLDAITLARRAQPDFIVLDYMMPGRDGQTAAPDLRAVVPDARIVAFSAALDSRPDWADAFLSKDHIMRMTPLLQTLIDEHSGP